MVTWFMELVFRNTRACKPFKTKRSINEAKDNLSIKIQYHNYNGVQLYR
jgi:hypothetical protein